MYAVLNVTVGPTAELYSISVDGVQGTRGMIAELSEVLCQQSAAVNTAEGQSQAVESSG